MRCGPSSERTCSVRVDPASSSARTTGCPSMAQPFSWRCSASSSCPEFPRKRKARSFPSHASPSLLTLLLPSPSDQLSCLRYHLSTQPPLFPPPLRSRVSSTPLVSPRPATICAPHLSTPTPFPPTHTPYSPITPYISVDSGLWVLPSGRIYIRICRIYIPTQVLSRTCISGQALPVPPVFGTCATSSMFAHGRVHAHCPAGWRRVCGFVAKNQ